MANALDKQRRETIAGATYASRLPESSVASRNEVVPRPEAQRVGSRDPLISIEPCQLSGVAFDHCGNE